MWLRSYNIAANNYKKKQQQRWYEWTFFPIRREVIGVVRGSWSACVRGRLAGWIWWVRSRGSCRRVQTEELPPVYSFWAQRTAPSVGSAPGRGTYAPEKTKELVLLDIFNLFNHSHLLQKGGLLNRYISMYLTNDLVVRYNIIREIKHYTMIIRQIKLYTMN